MRMAMTLSHQLQSLLLLALALMPRPLILVAEAQRRRIDRHVVPCGPQHSACECRESADECEFTLLVEELQTFVAYELETNDNPGYAPVDQVGLRDVPTRTEEGIPFYINATGSLIPSFPASNGDCSIYDEDFSGASPQCTVPITADGRTYRPCIAVNGRVPGPTLVVHENQTVVANVVNGMVTETISVHWHGMNQRNTPWMDGALHVNQCPIGPSESFQYYFKADPSFVDVQKHNSLLGHSCLVVAVSMKRFVGVILQKYIAQANA